MSYNKQYIFEGLFLGTRRMDKISAEIASGGVEALVYAASLISHVPPEDIRYNVIFDAIRLMTINLLEESSYQFDDNFEIVGSIRKFNPAFISDVETLVSESIHEDMLRLLWIKMVDKCELCIIHTKQYKGIPRDKTPYGCLISIINKHLEMNA